MNIGLIFLSALFTFIASKVSKNLAAILAFGALLPLLIITLDGYFSIVNASPEAVQQATDTTINRLTTYLGAHIGEWLVADMFGMMIGGVISAVTGR